MKEWDRLLLAALRANEALQQIDMNKVRAELGEMQRLKLQEGINPLLTTIIEIKGELTRRSA